MRHLTTTGGLVLAAYAAHMHGATSAGLDQHYGAKHPGERASAKPPKKWRRLPNLGSTQVCFAPSLHETLTSSLGSWIHSDCKDLQMLMLNLMFRILNWWSTLLLNEEKLCFLTKPKINSCNCAAWSVFFSDLPIHWSTCPCPTNPLRNKGLIRPDTRESNGQ